MQQQWGWHTQVEEAVRSLSSPHHTFHDSQDPPQTRELREVTDYCRSKKMQLFIGCDASAHHILWGSTSTNPRGESFVEYLVSLNLHILNQGNKPTFIACNRKEVTNLTLGTNKTENLASMWHVSNESSLSGHRYICFQICML
jgi:hypothetical protein